MKVHSQRISRRKGQVVVRIIFGLGILAALSLAFMLLQVNLLEAIVLPAIVLGAVTFGVALYSRARYRREWSAAWDAYAAERSSAESRESAQVDRKFSIVNAK